MLSKREKGTVAYLLPRALGVIISLIMVAGMIAAAISRPVLAETTDTVAYAAVDGGSATITDKDGSTQTVYGIGSGSIVSSDKAVGGDYADVRAKTVATDDAEHLGNDLTRGLIAGVLYYGYPKNATGLNASYADTQKAIDLAFDFAGKDLPESDAVTDGAAALYKAALAEPVTGATLYRYAPVAENDNEKYPLKSMVGASFTDAKTKKAASTDEGADKNESEGKTSAGAVSANEAKTNETAGGGVTTQAEPTFTISCDPEEITYPAGSKESVTITIHYSNLEGKAGYSMLPAFSVGNTPIDDAKITKTEPLETNEFTAVESGTGETAYKYEIDASSLADGDTITVKANLYKGADEQTPIAPEATATIAVRAEQETEPEVAVTYDVNIIRVGKLWETGTNKSDVTITVTDSAGETIDEWTTDEATEKFHTISVTAGEKYAITDSDGGKYMLAVAEGDGVPELTINGGNAGIDDEGNVVIGDPTYQVLITKTDEDGKALKGARLKIVDSDSKTVDTWTSTSDAASYALWAGTYTLTETKAPTDYQRITTKIKFTVDEKGKVTLETKKVNGSGKISVEKGDGSEVDNHIKLQNAKKTSSSSSATRSTQSATTRKADTTKAKNAKTGDDNPIAFLVMMFAVAVLTVIVFGRGRAKH